MQLNGKPMVEAFKRQHPTSRKRLSGWMKVVEGAEWKSLVDIQQTYSNKVEYVPNKDRYVFDVGGNTFRIITQIVFTAQTVLVTNVFTHAEYDRWCN